MENGRLAPGPPLEPLASISPTQFIAFRACRLRGMWSAGHAPPLLPPDPASRVGSIIHRLLEESGRGLLPPATDGSGIELRWQELVTEAEEVMVASGLERHLVPLRKSVRDFEVRKIQAIQRAREIAAEARPAPDQDASAAAGGWYGYELPVSSADGLVRGRIDAVMPSGEGPIIRDYKSGALFERAGEQHSFLRTSYVMQLRMYTALYAATTGTWPARLEVVPIAGQPYRVPFERNECDRLVQGARETLAEVNSAIARYRFSPRELQFELATPSPEACRSCLFRPGCWPYSEVSARGGKWPADVWGRVGEVRQLRNGRLLLAVERLDSRPARVRGLNPYPSRHPALPRLRPGESVGLFNLRETKSQDVFAESDLTVIYRLPPEPELKSKAPQELNRNC